MEFILKNGYIDLLALCETKLDESFPLNQFYVAEYTCTRNDRTASGGGLMFYIRSDIPHRRRYDLEKGIDCHIGFEVIIMEVMFTSKDRWLYVLGYKPPNVMISKFEDTFALLCDVVIKETANVVILGDFNCDQLKNDSLAQYVIVLIFIILFHRPRALKTQRALSLMFA